MTRILLIEDEPAVREMLTDELTVQGHEVIEAENGEEGFKKLVECPPELILCDRAMPGMSGYALLERIRSSQPQLCEVPFVFLTALADPRDRAAVDHLKPTGYLTKPIDFGALSEKISALTASKA